MGTNFYLKPRRLHFKQAQKDGKLVHIAKRSAGWRPLFHIRTEDDETGPISSVDDIRDLIDHGGFDIVSEYGDVLTPQQFEDDVVRWKGGGRSVPISNYSSLPNSLVHDREGNEFTCIDFR